MNKQNFSLLIIVIIALASIYNFFPEPKLPSGVNIDSLVVYKSKKQMLVYQKGKLLKSYQISLGDQPVGHKAFEGDEKTPEGIYYIDGKNAHSGYHKNLGISYPNARDKATAAEMGKSPGGDVKIHGLRNGIGFINKFQRWTNWTNGCIALTNSEIDELYARVKVGTKITIMP